MQPLCHICNLSLTEGVFPHQIKIASVILLYKAGDAMSFSHYRPVPLLCILYKVFEKFLYSWLLFFYLENFKMIYDNKFGFRKGHPTHMALMMLMDKIIELLEMTNS